MTTSEPGSPGRGLCFDAGRPRRKSRFTSCCPVPGPAPPSALPPFYYLHVDGRPTGQVSSRGGSRGAGLPVWRSTRRGDECLFPVPEHEPREGRRHTWFIPTAPPTRAVYPNLLHPVDAQRTFVPLGFTVNEAELTSVAPPVSTQPRGVALGTARFRPRGAGGVRSFLSCGRLGGGHGQAMMPLRGRRAKCLETRLRFSM